MRRAAKNAYEDKGPFSGTVMPEASKWFHITKNPRSPYRALVVRYTGVDWEVRWSCVDCGELRGADNAQQAKVDFRQHRKSYH